MKTEPTVTLANANLTVHIGSIADALELQRSIGESIAMALADGKQGRANGVPIKAGLGFAHGLNSIRFSVEVGKQEAYIIAFEENKKAAAK
jgi:hypothetical protein